MSGWGGILNKQNLSNVKKVVCQWSLKGHFEQWIDIHWIYRSWVLDYSRKSPKKGWVDDVYLHFWKSPWNLYICHFTLLKQASTPGNYKYLCYTPWKFQAQKSKINGKSTWLFLITPGKSTSFLIDSGISACFFQYLLKLGVGG